MAVNKLDPKVIFASEAPAQDTPAVFTNRTVGWGETRKNGGRPTIKQMNAEQQSTDLKILWLNENAVTPYDSAIDYPVDAVTIKDGVFKIFDGSVWNLFLDKTDIGLGDVDNTSDLNKPVSTATQTALDLKANKTYVDTSIPHNNLIDRNSSGAHETTAIVNNSGETQQQINDRVGATWYEKSSGYDLNDRVILGNGDIVRSTVANNIVDPDVDITGWAYVSKNVNSVSELLLLKGSNGNTIKLSSYYAGENKGGGSFYYDSTKLSINNGVTVFNGWVRDLSDKVLTTYDAGLKNDSTDATQKLRTIATNIGANFTVKIFGKHCVTSNIMFNSVPNLTIESYNEGSQEGEINAWDLRENWSFDRDTPSEAEIAIVRISNSPFSTVRCKIRGARKTLINFVENHEAGDCGIEFKNSPHSLVEDSDLSDFITWSVYSSSSDYTIVQNSKIYNCIRQSGVNIFNGSKHCKVLRNHIYDCGLYGVELECNFSKAITNSNEVAFNTIEKCKWGVGIIDNVGDSQVHSNTIRECFFGVAPTRLSVSKGISISNNKIYACHQGVHVFDSKNITVSGNIVDRLLYTTSIIQDQYSVVLELDGTSSFWTFAWALIAYDTSFVGKQIFINGVSYTITAQQNDPERGIYGSHYGYSGQTKITVDKPVEGVVYDNTLIRVVPPVSTYGVMTGELVGNPINNSISENVVISNNTFTGCTDGMRFASKFASGSLAKEFLYGNTFINCINWVRMAFAMSGYNVGLNEYTSQSVANIVDESVNNVNPAISYNFVNYVAKASGGSTRIHRSYLKETRTLIGYVLHIPNATITGDFQLKVNGSVRHTITASDFTNNADRLFIINKVLGVGYTSGVLNVEVTSANNTLAYNNYELELLFV